MISVALRDVKGGKAIMYRTVTCLAYLNLALIGFCLLCSLCKWRRIGFIAGAISTLLVFFRNQTYFTFYHNPTALFCIVLIAVLLILGMILLMHRWYRTGFCTFLAALLIFLVHEFPSLSLFFSPLFKLL